MQVLALTVLFSCNSIRLNCNQVLESDLQNFLNQKLLVIHFLFLFANLSYFLIRVKSALQQFTWRHDGRLVEYLPSPSGTSWSLLSSTVSKSWTVLHNIPCPLNGQTFWNIRPYNGEIDDLDAGQVFSMEMWNEESPDPDDDGC